ncbi:hypothetical protein NQT62_04000 [Limnobacter humi]|uniref:Uncharacterized protein n=1 Tax=Limnobacter humi TaxID=1778671 RepID=A0ABT1WDK8_9BURK|nr:hypothetical protein [Limnobacter humi]MCQ8895605.1 hypothetical protein [Limnobacter humi]
MALVQSATVATPIASSFLKEAESRVAKKNGYTRNQGNEFRKRAWWERFNEWGSKGKNLQSCIRGHYESSHYVSAALMREQRALEKRSASHAPVSIWDSYKTNAHFQARMQRQDYVRTRMDLLHDQDHARRAAAVAKGVMGLCEMTSAPTGFTYRMVKNLFMHKMSDNRPSHKALTAFISLPIGMLSSFILMLSRAGAADTLQKVGGKLLLSFAAFSALFGLASTVSASISQTAMRTIDLKPDHKAAIEKEMANTLRKINKLILHFKDKPDGRLLLARAMNRYVGADFRGGKIQTHKKDQMPVLIEQLEAALEPETSPEAIDRNLVKAQQVIGDYLGEVPDPPAGASAWTNYQHRKALQRRELHFATLAGLVEHGDIQLGTINTSPDGKTKLNQDSTLKESAQDSRTWMEGKAQDLNTLILKALIAPASSLDRLIGTRWAKTLKYWTDADYENIRKQKLADPKRAARNASKGEYMSQNIHQYGPITRSLIILSDTLHAINYNFVLAVNGSASRLFNWAFRTVQGMLTSDPASRTVCSSAGRFAGGAAVTAMYACGVAGVADIAAMTHSPFVTSVGVGASKLDILSTGTVMTGIGTLAVIALGLAKLSANLGGWNGNLQPNRPNVSRGEKLKVI